MSYLPEDEWVGEWVPKSDDAENEKNNHKTDEGDRKGKYKHLVLCQLMYKTFFPFSGKALKTVINSL